MAKKVGDLNESDIKKIRTEAIGLLNDIDSIGKSINSNLQKVSQITGESTAGFKESFNAAKSLGDALAKIDSETLKSKKQQTTFQDKVRKAQEEATKLEAKANRLRQEAVFLGKKQAKDILRVARAYEDGAEKLKEQAQAAGKITNEFEKLNNQTKIFDDMAEFTSQIPGLSKVFGEFQKASDAAREAASEGGNALAAGGKQLVGVAGKAAAAFALGNIVTAVKDLDERTTSASRNLNIGRGQAEKLAMSLNQAAKNTSGITGKEAQTAVEQFADTLGTTVAISAEDAVNFATMTKQLGLATGEAAKLETLSLAIGQSSKSITTNIIGEVKYSNYRNKSAVDYKKVLKDVGNANAAILLSIKGQGKGLGDAGVAARRFGLDLNKVDSIAENLLNFEQSIASELEAELLTGKELNLEDARRFALNGDIEGLTKEIQKNVGSAADFSKMNRLQQDAIAKSVGMTREELAASLIEQEALTKLGAKDAQDRDKIVDAEMSRIEMLQRAGKFAEAEAARKQLVGKLGSDELIRQRENRSLAELQLEATQKMAESMDSLASTVLPSLQATMQSIADNAGIFATILTTIGGLSLFSKFVNLGNVFKNINKDAGKIGTKFSEKQIAAGFGGKAAKEAYQKGGMKAAEKTLAKAGGKTLGKSLLKKIPIIGALAGIGFGLSRLAEGDLLGAAGEVASGLAGTIPGVGTAASVGIDAALLAKDVSSQNTETPLASGGIVTRPTRALVGEAGPEAVIPLDKLYAKLDELINVVKQGGSVYLDGTKVGTSMAVSTYKVQ
jgi:hypothetical protein